MDLLDYIIKYMNNKVEATSSMFTKTYGLSEIAQSGNIKSYAHYIGNGQLEPVTNFDAHNGTLFWIRRGDTSVSTEPPALLKDASCKNYVVLSYPLRAICVVKKEHLPCDNATAVDQVAQEMLHKLGGKDKALRTAIGAISLAINPSGYTVNIQGLPLSKEYASFGLDYTISIVFPQSCIPSICDDIALPPTPSPVPRKGTIIVQDEGVVVSSDANTLNFVGSGVVATLESPGVVRITISGGGGGSILLQTDGVNNGSQTVLNLKEGSNVTLTDDGVGGVTIAASGGGTPQVNSDWNAVSGVAEILNKPNLATVATSGSYTDLINQPSIPAAQVNSDWNSVSGVSEILNKPTIPAAQIQSDWTQANNAALDFIKNKPSIPSITGLVPYTGATQDVDLGVHGLEAHDIAVSFPSGSGVAVSITKGGAGEALTVTKTSGSGNAASITGGVTLLSELHLNTDLADTYIASAATWNAKQDALTLTTTGTSGAATLTGATLNIPIYAAPVIFKSVADSASFLSTTNTVVYTQLIDANTFAAGDIIRVTYRTRKTGSAGFMSLRIYVNATADLTGTPILIGGLVNSGTASSLFAQIQRHLVIKNASNNTETLHSAFTGSPTDINYAQGAGVNIINWTLARYFVFALQNSNAADTNFGSMYLIEKL